MDENNFEKFPSGGETEQAVPIGQDFEKAMDSGVPEFVGNEFGIKTGNESGDTETVNAGEGENGHEYDAGIADASKILNGYMDAAAKKFGVGSVIQTIENIDVSGSEDPMGDCLKRLGVDTPEERKELREESVAIKLNEAEFRNGINAPPQKRSIEDARVAIEVMKELISEVKGADPAYERMRIEAGAAKKDVFVYIAEEYAGGSLSKMFYVLGDLKNKSEEKDNAAFDGAEEDAEKEPDNKEDDIDDKTDMQTLNPEILKKVA